MPAKDIEDASMVALVSADKKTIVTEGVVKGDEDQSLSTLGKRQSALDVATSKSCAKGSKRLGASEKRQARQQAHQTPGEPTEELNERTSANPQLKMRQVLGREAAYELDQSEELEGTADAYDMADATRRAYGRYRGRKNPAGTASATKKGAGIKKSSSAQGAKKQGARTAGKVTVPQGATVATQSESAKAATVAASETKAAIGAIGGSGAAAAGGALAAIVAFTLCALVIGQVISALFGFWENEANKQSLEVLPPYITYEMVEEALACQEEYGHPAGCTIAQIICESGQGDTMSQLATRDHNLFGMKWSSSFAPHPEVTGKSGWSTKEEYTPGTITTITAYFTCFKSDVDCIRFRSRVFLQSSNYANNALIKEAISTKSSDKMAEGLKDAGWATSSAYTDSLKAIMDTYGLRRFDGMSVEDFKSSGLNGDAIVAAAQSQLGVPYVWGGTTPNVGLDCSGLTQYCYKQAGISIPRNSEDQYRAAKSRVSVSQAAIGDILYRPGHVAVYIGNDQYIHEPHSGASCTIAQGASYFTCALKFR